jgi:hypothetical protein
MKSKHKFALAMFTVALGASLAATTGLAICALVVPAFEVPLSVRLAFILLFAFTLAFCSVITGVRLAAMQISGRHKNEAMATR